MPPEKTRRLDQTPGSSGKSAGDAPARRAAIHSTSSAARSYLSRVETQTVRPAPDMTRAKKLSHQNGNALSRHLLPIGQLH